MKIFKFLFLALLLGVSVCSFAQTKGSIKAANEKFSTGNFDGALEEFLVLVQEDLNNVQYNYKIGVCYLNTNINKSKAIPYLELVTKQPKDVPVDAYYLLGRAYHFANKFDDAIKMYNKYKEIASKGNAQNVKDADREIEFCYNAKELVKFPLNVTFENLGKTVNSIYADYFPFISKDEGMLFFNSRRENNLMGVDGKYFSDVYVSTVKAGKWSKAKPIPGKVNTNEGDEEVVGLSPDGNQIVYNFDNNKSSGDLFIGTRKGEEFQEPKLIQGENVNSKYYEIAASLSTDDNSIYFASDRPGGFGGIDIYLSQKLPGGEWGPAQNLGPNINTKYDEDFPNISLDGKTLLFSSKGHTSMGGYDIFKSALDSVTNKWSPVKNVGYPINTSDDDLNMCLEEGGRNGYISAVREGGVGDQDIYRIVFNDIEPKYTVLKGIVGSADPNKKVVQPMITVTNNADAEIYGTYLTNPNTNRYVIILPPGKYNLMIEADGFITYSEDTEVLDKSSYQIAIEKDIQLRGK